MQFKIIQVNSDFPEMHAACTYYTEERHAILWKMHTKLNLNRLAAITRGLEVHGEGD